jgi:hypothetical protein
MSSQTSSLTVAATSEMMVDIQPGLTLSSSSGLQEDPLPFEMMAQID